MRAQQLSYALLCGCVLPAVAASTAYAEPPIPSAAEATPAPAATHAPAATPAQVTPATAANLAPAVPGPTASPTPDPAAPAAPAPKWYEKLTLSAFVDAYAAVNYNFPKPKTGTTAFHAFDVTDGFAVHWAALEASFAPGPVGGTISLRFGPGAEIYNAGDVHTGLIAVKQAFVSWRPHEKFTIDFGKYDQPYGSEVADSQLNMNYTRSILYWIAQPLYFTGFRLAYTPNDVFNAKLFAVNGWNNSVDMNRGKSVGVQLNVKPNASVFLSAGYMIGPEQADLIVDPTGLTPPQDNPAGDTNLRHLVDAIVDLTPNDTVRVLLNGNLGLDDDGTNVNAWYGGNAAVRFAVTPKFSVAARGGVLEDARGFMAGTGKEVTLVDGTLTLGFDPTPNLILKLDQRFDYATAGDGSELFQKGVGGTSKFQVTTVLGLVATTN